MLLTQLVFHIHCNQYLLSLSIPYIFHSFFALLELQILFLCHYLYDYLLSYILHIHIILHNQVKLLNSLHVIMDVCFHLFLILQVLHIAIRLVQCHLLLQKVFHVLIVMLYDIIQVFHHIFSRTCPYHLKMIMQHLLSLLLQHLG